MDTYRDKVEGGDFDGLLIQAQSGSDDWAEMREEMKAAELQEAIPATMSRMARKAYYDASWQPMGEGAGYTPFSLARIQKLCWYMYRNNWLFTNVIDNFTYLTTSGGFDVIWDDDKDDRRWRDIADEIRWEFRQMEIAQATFAYGEWFTLFWPPTKFEEPNVPKVKPSVRGIDPWNITNINRVAGDPEKVESYEQGADGPKYHPEDIIHHRVKYIGNFGRGLPICMSVLDPLFMAERFLWNWHWLSHIRARIPLIMRIRGGGTDVSNSKSRFGTNLPKPGTVWFQNEGERAEMPDLNIGAVDAMKLYRMFILAVAEGVGLPEFLVGGSAESSAYASLLAQESPTVRKLHHFQHLFAADFRRIITKLTGSKAFTLKIPPVITRDVKALAEAYAILVTNEIVSRETAAKETGHRWDGPDGEKERLAADKWKDGNFVPEETWNDPDLEYVQAAFRRQPDLRRDVAEKLIEREGGNGKAKESFLRWTGSQ